MINRETPSPTQISGRLNGSVLRPAELTSSQRLRMFHLLQAYFENVRLSDFEDDLADVVAEDRERVAQEYRNYIETGKDCVVEYRIRRKDGQVRWLRELTRAKLIEDGKVRQTLGVVQDVTERVAREQELVFKDAMAKQAELITDIGYFLFE